MKNDLYFVVLPCRVHSATLYDTIYFVYTLLLHSNSVSKHRLLVNELCLYTLPPTTIHNRQITLNKNKGLSHSFLLLQLGFWKVSQMLLCVRLLWCLQVVPLLPAQHYQGPKFNFGWSIWAVERLCWVRMCGGVSSQLSSTVADRWHTGMLYNTVYISLNSANTEPTDVQLVLNNTNETKAP